jgi:YD repeat-containing protein
VTSIITSVLRRVSASNSSDDYIVAAIEYDDAGRPFATTDNLGRVTKTFYDLLGRRTKLVENGGTSLANIAVKETDTDRRRTTEWAYDSAGRLSYQRARNPRGNDNAGSDSNNIQDQDTCTRARSTGPG